MIMMHTYIGHIFESGSPCFLSRITHTEKFMHKQLENDVNEMTRCQHTTKSTNTMLILFIYITPG